MNALIWNKIAAALLLALLLYKGIEIFAEGAFEVTEPGTKAYVVAGLEAAAPEIVMAPQEVAPAEDIMALLAVASPEQGKRIFRRCQACHDVAQGSGHKIGPNLFAVIGAPVAQHADYRYSDALAGHGGIWDFALMDDWLAAPADAMPGNKMSFGGMPKAGDRAALIAYLNNNSDSPLALPNPLPAAAPDAPEAIEPEATAPEATAPEATGEVMEETAREISGAMPVLGPVPGESVEEMTVEETIAAPAEDTELPAEDTELDATEDSQATPAGEDNAEEDDQDSSDQAEDDV